MTFSVWFHFHSLCSVSSHTTPLHTSLSFSDFSFPSEEKEEDEASLSKPSFGPFLVVVDDDDDDDVPEGLGLPVPLAFVGDADRDTDADLTVAGELDLDPLPPTFSFPLSLVFPPFFPSSECVPFTIGVVDNEDDADDPVVVFAVVVAEEEEPVAREERVECKDSS